MHTASKKQKGRKSSMKKLFAIIMIICMLATTLCVPAFAADPDSDVVLRVSGLKNNNSVETIGTYTNFFTGWRSAMNFAEDEDYMEENGYDRIVIDVCADWKAVYGTWDPTTLTIREGVKVTINMNGYTFDSDLFRSEDGEVMYVNDDADVIINNGTIKGGWSHGGAGAIHIKDDANVTLNNVHIVGNISEWDGAGISLESGSVLTVNGGSFKDNIIDSEIFYGEEAVNDCYGGAVYVESATAIFNGVEFKNNLAPNRYNYGAAIYANNSKVFIEKCTFDGNGAKTETSSAALSVIEAIDSSITVKESIFTNNGGKEESSARDYSTLFYLDDAKLTVEASEFSNNASHFIIFDEDDSSVFISNTKFVNNAASVMRGDSNTYAGNFFDTCTFENNGSYGLESFYDINAVLTFYNCVMGNATFNVKDFIRFVNNAPDVNHVLRLSALKKDGTIVEIMDHASFEDGWNEAMALATNVSKMKANNYDRVVVDLLTNWKAVDGEFTDDFHNGPGFDWDTIYVPENVRVTINMNGYTIDRGLAEEEDNGEVMYVDEGADLIINGGKIGDTITRGDDTGAAVQFGTITGGHSDNGAGGIHINGAHVELNNVKVKGNIAEYDDGAGIAAYDATVIIRGGSLSDNTINSVYPSIFCYGGGLYAEGCTVTLEKVEIKNNQTLDSWSIGMGIYVEESKVTVDQCIFDGNGVGDTGGERPYPGFSTVYANDSNVTFTKTTFINNGSPDGSGLGNSVLFEFDTDSHLEMDECVIKNNAPMYLFDAGGTGRATCSFYVKNTTITDNASAVIGEEIYISGCFENCTFNNNEYPNKTTKDFSPVSDLVLRNCSMGDSSYDDYRLDNIKFQDADGNAIAVGSIFGEGSLTMIVALIGLIVAIASICVNVAMNKKKNSPATVAEKDEE